MPKQLNISWHGSSANRKFQSMGHQTGMHHPVAEGIRHCRIYYRWKHSRYNTHDTHSLPSLWRVQPRMQAVCCTGCQQQQESHELTCHTHAHKECVQRVVMAPLLRANDACMHTHASSGLHGTVHPACCSTRMRARRLLHTHATYMHAHPKSQICISKIHTKIQHKNKHATCLSPSSYLPHNIHARCMPHARCMQPQSYAIIPCVLDTLPGWAWEHVLHAADTSHSAGTADWPSSTAPCTAPCSVPSAAMNA